MHKPKIEKQHEALESKGFKRSCKKTEYMDCNFSRDVQIVETIMRIEVQEIPQRDSFRYFGIIISKDGEIEKGAGHRTSIGWLKWRLTLGVLCNRCIPTRLKGNFYKMAIRPAMTYRAKCWPIKKQHAQNDCNKDENVKMDVW